MKLFSSPVFRLILILLLFLQSGFAQNNHPTKSVSNSHGSSASKSTNSHPSSHSSSHPNKSTKENAKHSITSKNHVPASSHTNSPKPKNKAPPPPGTVHQQPSQNATDPDIDLLPIRPEITPAFGLAGVILMITGLAYTIVGVRQRKPSIFLSVAYLVALAVTVLVLYVCDPPVSDAVQAAYFIAALASGCIIGGLSLLFTEVTEGLGCLLGGFCLAMWFLVLRPGGLVTSVGGRVAMIASLSIAAFALSFSRYTRTYGLLCCIAFAGATIVILGIDCFSRAGLKEFWLYIWNLNDSLFPLDTTTYPMTRGIKVEIAGIILLFLCGILSQWKLYKILKDRKEKKEKARAEDDEAREHLEADLGRQIEDKNARERALWEEQYGVSSEKIGVARAESLHPSGYQSSIGSRAESVKDMTANTNGVIRSSSEIMEMQNLAPGSYAVSVRSVYDEATPLGPYNGSSKALDRIEEAESRPTSKTAAQMEWENMNSASLQQSVSPPPAVVPLPFTVTTQELRDRDETESLATAGDIPMKRLSKTRSAKKSLRAVSDTDSDEEPLPDIQVPHVEDDRASSVAATLDDLTDGEDDKSLPSVSRPASPTRRSVRQNSKRVKLRRVGSDTDLQNAPPSIPDSAVSGVKSKRRLSEPPPTDLVELIFNEPDPKQPEELSNILNLTTAKSNKRMSTDSKARSGTQSGRTSVIASLSAVKMMRQPSIAAQKYRTHEWTKYLSDAEQPLPGDLDPSEDGVRVNRYSRESSTPVNVESLQETASRFVKDNSRNSVKRSISTPIIPNEQTDSIPPMPLRSDTRASFVSQNQAKGSIYGQPLRTVSQPTVTTQRNFSTPIVPEPLVESPVEEIPGQRTTLLGVRESILRQKASATNLHRIQSMNASNPNFGAAGAMLNQPALSETSSIRSGVPTPKVDPDNISLASLKQKMDEDNMPLSRRRTIIQMQMQQPSQQPSRSVHRLSGGSLQSHQSQSQSQPQPQATWPDPSYQLLPSTQNLIHDAHLPQRGPSVDAHTRQSRMATFRESLRQGIGASSAPAHAAAETDGHRSRMLTEKRHAQAQLQQREYQKQVLDSVVDQGMRNGAMLDLHKERLRKMQSMVSTK